MLFLWPGKDLGSTLCWAATAGLNPQWYVPAPTFQSMVRSAPAKSLLHCRPKRFMPPALATDTNRGPSLELGSLPLVHHRSPPSSTPWKTQCAQSIPATAECPSMECQGIDQVWHWSCAGLGAHSGQPGGVFLQDQQDRCPAWPSGLVRLRPLSLQLAPIDRK